MGRARFNFILTNPLRSAKNKHALQNSRELWFPRTQIVCDYRAGADDFIVGKSAPALAAEIAEGEIAGIQLLIDAGCIRTQSLTSNGLLTAGSGGANPIYADASDFRLRTADGKAEEISCAGNSADCTFSFAILETATQLGVGQLPVPISGLIDWKSSALPDGIVEPGRSDNFGGNKELFVSKCKTAEGYQNKENHNGIQIAIVDAAPAPGSAKFTTAANRHFGAKE